VFDSLSLIVFPVFPSNILYVFPASVPAKKNPNDSTSLMDFGRCKHPGLKLNPDVEKFSSW
jgi:hypothetical protein